MVTLPWMGVTITIHKHPQPIYAIFWRTDHDGCLGLKLAHSENISLKHHPSSRAYSNSSVLALPQEIQQNLSFLYVFRNLGGPMADPLQNWMPLKWWAKKQGPIIGGNAWKYPFSSWINIQNFFGMGSLSGENIWKLQPTCHINIYKRQQILEQEALFLSHSVGFLVTIASIADHPLLGRPGWSLPVAWRTYCTPSFAAWRMLFLGGVILAHTTESYRVTRT